MSSGVARRDEAERRSHDEMSRIDRIGNELIGSGESTVGACGRATKPKQKHASECDTAPHVFRDGGNHPLLLNLVQ
jgi:hypothetical protein